MIPGEIVYGPGDVEVNEGRGRVTVSVVNTGDRPVQVGSHFHFFEANEALAYDRDSGRGRRLDIPAGTSVRFEPGVAREVELVDFSGRRVVAGFRGLIGGAL